MPIGLVLAALVAVAAWVVGAGDGGGEVSAVMTKDVCGETLPAQRAQVLALTPSPAKEEATANGETEIDEREAVAFVPRARVVLRGELRGTHGLGGEMRVSVGPIDVRGDERTLHDLLAMRDGGAWTQDVLDSINLPPPPFPSPSGSRISGAVTTSDAAGTIEFGAAGGEERYTIHTGDQHVTFTTRSGFPVGFPHPDKTLSIEPAADGTIAVDVTAFFADSQHLPKKLLLSSEHANFVDERIYIDCRTADGQAIDRALLSQPGEVAIAFGADLQPRYIVRGQAALCDGVSEQVTVAAWKLSDDGRPAIPAGHTDIFSTGGRFTFHLERDSDYAITAFAADSAPRTQFFRTDGELNIELPTFLLERGAAIAGRVDLARHSFGASASVTAVAAQDPSQRERVSSPDLWWNGAEFERRGGSAQAESDGSFRISGLAPGRYKLRLAIARDWAPADVTFDAYAPSSDLVLAPRLVHVTLQLELDHAALAQHQVRARSVGDSNGRGTPMLTTDDEGRASLWLMPGEQYLVEVPMSERDTRTYGKIVPWNGNEVTELVQMGSH